MGRLVGEGSLCYGCIFVVYLASKHGVALLGRLRHGNINLLPLLHIQCHDPGLALSNGNLHMRLDNAARLSKSPASLFTLSVWRRTLLRKHAHITQRL